MPERAASAPVAAPTLMPIVDSAQQLRNAIAEDLQIVLRERGCADCTVAALGTTLRVVAPTLAPRTVAQIYLGEKKTRRGLIDLGFEILSVSQDSGFRAQIFDYQVRPKR